MGNSRINSSVTFDIPMIPSLINILTSLVTNYGPITSIITVLLALLD